MLASVLACGCGGDEGNTASERDAAAAVFAPCPESTPAFELGRTAIGENDHIREVLREATPFPAKKYSNDWTFEFTDAHGNVLFDAQIKTLETFMPVHGHYGRPPAIWGELDETGKVHVELHFTMRGPWEVRLDASSKSAGDDRIVFEVCVQE